MLQLFGYISAGLCLVMIFPYVRDIFWGKTQPVRASWWIWSILGSISFASQLAKGAGDSLWLTAGQTLAVIIVALLSIKYGVGGYTKRDMWALLLAGLGLILWYVNSEAAYALLIVIFIDTIGSILTMLKAYKQPTTETLSTWILSGTSGVFGTLAVGSINPILLAYPLYITVTNYGIAVAILAGRRKLKE
jgi:hypothetical protein